jgi:divalent metal cation (Fe/Co/Zn/Cd) transporter
VAHDIAHQAEDAVRREVAKIARVFVHVEPGEFKDEPRCPTCDPDGHPAPR